MPTIRWSGLPPALRDHLFERLRERKITAEDLYQLKAWRESNPDAPDGLCIVGFDLETRRYVQHYFDSRGVARTYSMTLDEGRWELLRDAPDFTPLDFWQRPFHRARDDAVCRVFRFRR